MINLKIFAKFSKESTNVWQYTAFTLAEVLIVLGIIGIIAAITIPSIINNVQNQQTITSLKKFYTSFNQILITMASANGCNNDLACTGLFSSLPGSTSNQTLGDELIKYIKFAKNCETGSGCFAESTNGNSSGTGQDYNFGNNGLYSLVTADGMSIDIMNWSNDCKTPTYSNDASLGYMTQVCGYIVVDVNGTKAPNFFGRDTFSFWITNGKGPLLYPFAGKDDKYTGVEYWWDGSTKRCTGSGYNDGIYCAGRIIEEGWKITY